MTKWLARVVRLRYAIAVSTILIVLSYASNAEARRAQCLLEVKGFHYIGGPCEFIPLDSLGSFRITVVQGLKLIAQIDVSKKDEGKAIWNGPLGGTSGGTELGDASRDLGCWLVDDSSPDKYDASRICAWSLKEKIYLGASPKDPQPSEAIYYGHRVGEYVEIESRKGIDSAAAKITTKSSKEAAIQYCREYKFDYTLGCVNGEMADNGQNSITGNCTELSFNDFAGNRYLFLGKNKPKEDDQLAAEYAIKDVATGEILEDDVASGYAIKIGIFEALCPSSVEKSKQ